MGLFSKKKKESVATKKVETVEITKVTKIAEEMEPIELPKFKYSPNCFENGVFKKAEPDEPVICECCSKRTQYYYEGIYAEDEVDYICPWCIASGAAAEKFDGEFIANAEKFDGDAKKTEELFKQTPGYESWQQEYWLVHCNDYCAFIGDVGTKELEEMGIADEVFADYADQNEIKQVRDYLCKAGSPAGYLFQCLHCGKYRIGWDSD